MKILIYELPEPTTTTTLTTAVINYNDNSVEVTDASEFSVDDFVLIEIRGSELNEILKINSISGNELLFSTNFNYPHNANITITKLNYDKYKVTRSVNNINYELVEETQLNYAEPSGMINLIDMMGNDNYYYKIYYVNTNTTTEDLQDTIKNNTISNLSIDEFKRDTGFDLDNNVISSALRAGLEWVQDNAYKATLVETTIQDKTFSLDLDNMTLCDWNGDDVIDKNDMIVFEEDASGNRCYINHKIIKVYPNSNRVLFSEDVPRTGYTLVFNLKTTFKPLDEIRTTLKTILKLIATNWLLRNVDTSKIKGGITSWNAGGTNVNRDMNAVKDSIDKNYQEAQRLLHQILKIYMLPTKMRTTYSHLNWGMQRHTRQYSGMWRR